MTAESGDLWVFGYGSLMWRPGFRFVERHSGRIHGFHRALCIFSHVHRGTPERPGLVLGLDRGGSCRGTAFRVDARRRQATLQYLRQREQVTAVYLERWAPVTLDDGRLVTAVTFVADRNHEQYAGRLTPAELLRLVQQGIGSSGGNPEYVRNTHAHLLEAGIHDPVLEVLVGRLEEPMASRDASPSPA